MVAAAIVWAGCRSVVRAAVGNGSEHQNEDQGKCSYSFHDSLFSFSGDEKSVRLFAI